eukprot:PLAT339.1.p2 GENE.PLAT339.1~~PLAT339.1.p2  ORF type:complete len:247 (+),score=124.67 PLAT339.1:43-741(+)
MAEDAGAAPAVDIPHLVQLSGKQLTMLFTGLRSKDTSVRDFVFYADRINRLLVEEVLTHLPLEEKVVETPTGTPYTGLAIASGVKLCGVSIVRAGDSMLSELRSVVPGLAVGKILIQRDEETATPKLFYSKFPPDIAERHVLLVDPMVGTGGSCKMAISVLLDAGVKEENIVFLSLVSCPEGNTAIYEAYPAIKHITACMDPGMNEHKYIVPGLGDFGCRYFGTDEATLPDY